MDRRAVIAGTGMFVPEQVIGNDYFDRLLGEDVGTWLVENLTIRERRWCREDESTADLCEAAARNILDKSGVSPEDLDLIIVATDTPEFISPSTSAVLQDRLGAKKAGTFDINTACAGFVTALDVASKYIIADAQYQNVLVIGAYAMSKYLNKSDKKTVTLFADGAAGVLLQAQQDSGRGFLLSSLHTEGQYNSWMGIYAGGTAQPASNGALANHDHQLKFVRKFPRELNPLTWEKMIREMCRREGVQPSDIRHFFFTQININSIFETMDALGIDRQRAYTVMDRYGYTGSACIPMALAEADRAGKLQPGDLMALVGSGGGLAFASALFRF
ncbi:MAG: ketoacyl-ACP synthase III [Calditrichaeota bacterium]|nr:ketoacyl-ACP synthase III [Calditrichota bacterium]HQU73032.1 ketoacyl-ACP synthase III [Calditrichia bacterium]